MTRMREHLNTEQAAEYLGVSESWLAGSRVRGDGPPFYRLGRAVRYIRSALDAWANKRQVMSTSQREQFSE
jgi:excisionase family DNA binding protein